MSIFQKIKIAFCAGLLFLACTDDQDKKLASGYTEEQNAGIIDPELAQRLKSWKPQVPVDSTERTATIDSATISWYEILFTTIPEKFYEYEDSSSASCKVSIYEQENGVRLDIKLSETTNVYTEILMRDSTRAIAIDRLDNSYDSDSSAQCHQDSSAFAKECENNNGSLEDLIHSPSCTELHLVCTRKFKPKVEAEKFLENTAKELQKRCEDKFIPKTDSVDAPNKEPVKFDSILVDDRDGQTYKTTVVNGQHWMAENLKYDAGDASTCYGEVEDNCSIYGKIYHWDSTLCPTGWRMPSQEEYCGLAEFVDDDISRLKSASGWETPGTDEFGLNFLPGGMCGSADNGKYSGIGEEICLWTSDYMGMPVAVNLDATGDIRLISKQAFLYVRCIEE